MAKPIQAVDKILPQSAFMLLQVCFNAQPCYLSRVAEPHIYWDAMERFDQEVDIAVGKIAGVTTDGQLKILRSLPQRYGGLGILRHHGSRSEKVCKDSRNRVLEFIDANKDKRPDIIEGTKAWSDLSEQPDQYMGYTDLSLMNTFTIPEDMEVLPEGFSDDLGWL
jgi:hypothetical protein